MRRRHALIALAAVPGCLPALASEPVPALMRDIRQRMADAPVLRGAFEQRKAVKGFRNPLLSRGEFVVVRNRGVLWLTQEPFASSLVVTRERVLARNADGTVARRLSTQEEPALRTISETLFALMAADFAVLSQRFQADGHAAAEGWKLVLMPRDPVLARWLQRVELDGDRFLRGVRLHEGSGDVTQIRLARHAIADAPSPAEEIQFG